MPTDISGFAQPASSGNPVALLRLSPRGRPISHIGLETWGSSWISQLDKLLCQQIQSIFNKVMSPVHGAEKQLVHHNPVPSGFCR